MSLSNREKRTTHKARELRRSTIKEEMLMLVRQQFRGDFVDAILLNSLITLQSKSRQVETYIEEERARFLSSGTTLNIPPIKGWFYKKAAELSVECMLDLAETTMRNRLKKFIEAGFLLERNNPHHKWDKTKQYRVDIIEIDRVMQTMGLRLDGWLIEKIHVPDPTATDDEGDDQRQPNHRSSEFELRNNNTELRDKSVELRDEINEPRNDAHAGAIPSRYSTGSRTTRNKNTRKQQHQTRETLSETETAASPMMNDDDVFSSNSKLTALPATPSSDLDSVTTADAELPMIGAAPVSTGGDGLRAWLCIEGVPDETARRFAAECEYSSAVPDALEAALKKLGGRGTGRTSPGALVAKDAEKVRRQLAVWEYCPEFSAEGIRNPYGILAERIAANDAPPPDMAARLAARWAAQDAAAATNAATTREQAAKAAAQAYFAALSEKQKREFERDLGDEIPRRCGGQMFGRGTPEYSQVRLEMLNDPKTHEWLATLADAAPPGQSDITGDIMSETAEDFAEMEYSVADALTIERAAEELALDIRNGVFLLGNVEGEARELYPQFDDDEIAQICATVQQEFQIRKAA